MMQPIRWRDGERRDRVRGAWVERVVVETPVLARAEHEGVEPAPSLPRASLRGSAVRATSALLRARQAVQLARDEPAVLVLRSRPSVRGESISVAVELDDALEDVLEARRRRRARGRTRAAAFALSASRRCRLVEARVLDARRPRGRRAPRAGAGRPRRTGQTELRDDDHADDARPVAQRHGEKRLLDRRRARDPRRRTRSSPRRR